MTEKRTHWMILFVLLSLLIVEEWQGGLGSETPPLQPNPAVPVTIVPYFAPPRTLDFCGEAVPMDDQEVAERFDREFTIVVYGHAQVYLWLKRAARYFPWIEQQLVLNNLPEDMKYVAVAESDLLSSACSPAGATGPWQFTSGTGTRYGLEQSGQIDERHDFEKATASAFHYLNDLHNMFQNWTLAAAAYNCGEKRIQKEVERQKASSYYSLKLPQETERYIFRILAIKEVLSHPDRYGYYLPKDAGYPAIRMERVNVQLPYTTPVTTLAEAAGVTYREIKVLNPWLVSDTIPRGSYAFKVPDGKGTQFVNRIESAKAASAPSFIYHKVAKGETLSSIAAQYGVGAESLRELNQLQDESLRTGQTLKVQK